MKKAINSFLNVGKILGIVSMVTLILLGLVFVIGGAACMAGSETIAEAVENAASSAGETIDVSKESALVVGIVLLVFGILYVGLSFLFLIAFKYIKNAKATLAKATCKKDVTSTGVKGIICGAFFGTFILVAGILTLCLRDAHFQNQVVSNQ